MIHSQLHNSLTCQFLFRGHCLCSIDVLFISHGYPFATHASAMLCSSSAGRVLFLQSSYGLGWVSMSHGVGLVSMSLSFLCRKGACLPNMYITLTITQDLI